MLVLTRDIGESVVIGEDIKIVVLRKRGKRTVLGITAPKEIVVTRSELINRKSSTT